MGNSRLDSSRLRSGQAGQAMMVATILFLVVSITIIFGMAGPILKQQKMVSQSLLSRQSYFLAEAGIEDVVYRLKTGQPVSATEVLNLSGNTAKIIGNVYSSGNIIGTNSARIQGMTIASGPTGVIDGMDIDGDAWSRTIRGNSTVGGNATHAVLQNTTVTGNVVADSISNCTIGGTAKYDTKSNCTVNGAATIPNPDAFVPADVLSLPI